MNRKGQIFSTDSLLALVVFTLVVALTAALIQQVQLTGEDAREQQADSSRTQRILYSLLSSPGIPSYWEDAGDWNAVSLIGLSDGGGFISPSKWSALQDWNGEDYPSLLSHFGIPDRNFYLSMWDLNHSLIEETGLPPVDANTVSSITLPSLYEGEIVMVQLQVHTQ